MFPGKIDQVGVNGGSIYEKAKVNHKIYNYLCFLWRLWIWLRQETPHLTWELQRVSRHKDACFSSALVSTWLIYSHTAPSAHFSLNRTVLRSRLIVQIFHRCENMVRIIFLMIINIYNISSILGLFVTIFVQGYFFF